MHYQFFNFVINLETSFKIVYYCTNIVPLTKVWSASFGSSGTPTTLAHIQKKKQFTPHHSGTLNFLPLGPAKEEHCPVVLVNLHQVNTDSGLKKFSVQRKFAGCLNPHMVIRSDIVDPPQPSLLAPLRIFCHQEQPSSCLLVDQKLSLVNACIQRDNSCWPYQL